MLHKTNWTGVWDNDQAGDLEFDVQGNQVFLTFPKVIKPASKQNNITNTNPLPELIRPSVYRKAVLIVENGGTANTVNGVLQIGPDGILIMGVDPNLSAFSGQFATGFISQTIVYTL